MHWSKPVVSSTELLDADSSVLLGDEHAATLRDRLDHVARQAEDGGLVRRAVAGDERATPFGEPVEDATQRGRERGGLFLDEFRVGLAEGSERPAPSLLVGRPPTVLGRLSAGPARPRPPGARSL